MGSNDRSDKRVVLIITVEAVKSLMAWKWLVDRSEKGKNSKKVDNQLRVVLR